MGFGVIHTVVAPLEQRQRDVWADILDQGPWTTISPDDVTPEKLPYSEAFWIWPGSFGVPVLLLALS